MSNQADFQYEMTPMLEYGFFWITFQGNASFPRLGKAHANFLTHPDFYPGVDELLDFSGSDISYIDEEIIEQLISYMKDQPGRHNSRSVIVVKSPLEFGLTRMMGSNMSQSAPADRAVCYNIDEALEWLHPGKTKEIKQAFSQRSHQARNNPRI